MTIQDRVGKYLQAGRNWFTRDVATIKVFSIHHDAIPQDTRTADQVMTQIYNGHKANGWPGASYHYYIHRDGTVYQLNKHEWVTWVDGVNWDCIGIVLNGYFHSPHNNKPTSAQLASLKELLNELSSNHPEFPADQSGVYGHRERAQTSCPGDTLFPFIKEYREKLGDVNWGSPAPTPPPQPPINDQTIIDLGPYGKLEVQQIKGKMGDLAKAQLVNATLLSRLKEIHKISS